VHVLSVICALICIGGADEGHLVKGSACELQAEGQAAAIHSAGQRDGRQACQIPWIGEAPGRREHTLILRADPNGPFPDTPRSEGQGWPDNDINVREDLGQIIY